MAEAAGWAILDEQVTDSSRGLEDGESWELDNAMHQIEELVGSKGEAVSAHARNLIIAEGDLLDMLGRQGKRESLPTYMFAGA